MCTEKQTTRREESKLQVDCELGKTEFTLRSQAKKSPRSVGKPRPLPGATLAIRQLFKEGIQVCHTVTQQATKNSLVYTGCAACFCRSTGQVPSSLLITDFQILGLQTVESTRFLCQGLCRVRPLLLFGRPPDDRRPGCFKKRWIQPVSAENLQNPSLKREMLGCKKEPGGPAEVFPPDG